MFVPRTVSSTTFTWVPLLPIWSWIHPLMIPEIFLRDRTPNVTTVIRFLSLFVKGTEEKWKSSGVRWTGSEDRGCGDGVEFRTWTRDIIWVSTPRESRGPTKYVPPWSLSRFSMGTIQFADTGDPSLTRPQVTRDGPRTRPSVSTVTRVDNRTAGRTPFLARSVHSGSGNKTLRTRPGCLPENRGEDHGTRVRLSYHGFVYRSIT